jgi:hypothetical protein
LQALGINPLTLTPEMMLNIARLDRLHGGSVVVVPLHTDMESVGFSHEELVVQEKTYERAELLICDWRLVGITFFEKTQ